MSLLLHRWVTLQAEQRPDAGALVMGDLAMTYGELEAASSRLAHLLRAAGCRRGDRVCLALPKSPDAIVAILAVQKADAIFVPLDTASPAPRLARILDSCENRWVLATGETAALVDELLADERRRERTAVGTLDPVAFEGRNFRVRFSRQDLAAQPATPPASENAPMDPSHLLFTSGSTGVPKGVVITHANVVHFVEWAVRYFDIRPGDRLSGHPPLHFDLSTFDIFGAFRAGAELHLVSHELNLLPHKLAAFIRESGLTQWFSVPSVLAYMAQFDVVRPGDFPTLRRLLWCGEVFPTPALIHWMKRVPHATFTNLYGPTEATIASSYYRVPECPADEGIRIPIGTACDGEELLVLDRELRRVPPGEAGDLYIRGVGLSPGYWRDPERTRQVFLPNPETGDPADRIYRTGDRASVGADGRVYFHGREDTQIKSRGYRIELGEIEAALDALGLLREAAVVATGGDSFAGATICCAYAVHPGVQVTSAGLRKELARRLPPYMLPSRWMAMEVLPKNANGKIDRGALRERFEAEKHEVV